ncbi:MAG TPA: glycosyltransferase, partial [Bacteroidetes bacterium]|nr:glycosyltransferase [Bacteroidota bacterium]
MKILIIIPTLNASARLPKLLQKLQPYKNNILIIDSSSDDNSAKLAKDHGVKVHEIPRKAFNHATTRNIALNYDADFYLFMTQ